MGKLRVAVSGSAAALLLCLSMMGSTPVRAQAVAIEEEPALVIEEEPAATIEEVEDEQPELVQPEDDGPVDDGFVLLVADDGSGDDGGDTGEEDPSDPPQATEIARGTCGGCSWVIDFDQCLTISPTPGGTGKLEKEGSDAGWPWEAYGDTYDENGQLIPSQVSTVRITEGVSVASDASGISDASGMFAFYSSLTSADVANLNVSDVTNMAGMFQGCSSLESLDLSAWKWNVGSVVNTRSMFDRCSSLKSLNVTGLVTSSTQNISNMFSECSSLSNLAIAEWDTSAVTNMAGMFQGCSSLESLDLSTWNVGSVASTRSMFQGCSLLGSSGGSLNLSGWRPQQVTTTKAMFQGCSALRSLDLSGWDTSQVTSMNAMFQGCSALRSLDLSGWDTSQVTSMNAMFKDCGKLKSIGLERWNVTNVTDMDSVFYGCKSLASLDLSQWDTSSAFTMRWLFYNCSALESLDLSGLNMQFVTSVADMFEQCVNLAKVTVGEHFSLRTDLGEGNSLPFYSQWRSSKTRQKYDAADIPEWVADTYTIMRYCMIDLQVKQPSLKVTLTPGNEGTVPANITVGIPNNAGKPTFANASSHPTAKKFSVNASTGAISVPVGTPAGQYEIKMKVVVPESVSYYEASASASFMLTVDVIQANPMVVSAKKSSVAVAYNASAATSLGVNVSVGSAKGKLTYTNASTNATAKRFSVNASTGAISVPKGTPVGTYDMVVKVSAAKSAGYWSKEGTATFKVVVNKAASSIRLGDQTKTYTGKALAYTGTVTKSGSTGAVTYAYYRDASCTKAVKAADVKGAGVYYVKATVAASATHAAATSAAAKFTISKAANPMTVKAKAQNVKAKTLKSKAVVVAPIVVKNAQGKVTYAKTSGPSNISINKKTGKVTVKKKTKKGTYKIKVKVAAAGNANYESSTKTVNVKIVVK